MREELMKLSAALLRPVEEVTLPELDQKLGAAQTIVVLPAGGFGFRMRAVGQDSGPGAQKCLLPLPSGDTLIDRVIGQYVAAGFRRFVALVNYEGEAVERHLDGGSRWGVDVKCSYDPDATGSGRTGAILNALENGTLPADSPVIIHNADNQIVGYRGNFAEDLLRTHLAAVRDLKAVGTLAVVDGFKYPYTGVSVDGLRVRAVEMYPFVPVPAHAGITVLTTEGLAAMRERGGHGHFERDVFPRWAEAGRLGAMVISHETWFAVDDRKAYREITKAVEAEMTETPRD